MIDFSFGARLDSIQRKDLDELRAFRNHRKINEWCRQIGLVSEFDQERWYERINTDKSIRMFAIKGMLDDSIKGVCGLTSIDYQASRAEFSLYIEPNSQGMGYGKKALKTLLKFGFNDLGLNLIWGETFEGNPALDMFQSLGMFFEGTRREFYFKDGRFINAHLVSMTHMEFLEAKWSST